MAAQIYYPPFIPAFSSNGAPVAGALLNFYVSGTTVRSAVFADEGLTVPLPNPVVADAAGKYPNIYLNETVTYRVIQTGPDGIQLGDAIDPYVPGQALKGDQGAPGPADNTYTTLAALLASDPSRKSARLVPGPSETAPAGNFSYIGGAWVRQEASGITMLQPDSGAVPTDLEDFLRRTKRAQAFGAHRSFGPQDGAQNVALQKAIDAAASYSVGLGSHLDIPWGTYYLADSLKVFDYASIRGEGPRATILYNEQVPLNAPAIILGSSVQVGFTEIEGIGFRGYGVGIDVPGATDGLAFRRLHFLRCEYGIRFGNLLQTTILEECEFDQCGVPLLSPTSVGNRVTYSHCGFKNSREAAIPMSGAEDLLVIAGRFEGGGQVGKATIDLSNVRNALFVGGYMESTHQYALRLVASAGGVVTFEGFHWTGTGVKNADLSYEFLVDGTGTIVFRDCHATYPMRIPPNSVVEGECPGLIRSEWQGKMKRKPYRPTSTTFDMLRFARPDATNDPTNYNSLSGRLVVHGVYASADGGIFGTFNRRIPFAVAAQGSATVNATIGADAAMDTGSGANFAVRVKAGATSFGLTIEGQIAGIDAANLAVFQVGFEVEWDQIATIGDGLRNNFSVERV